MVREPPSIRGERPLVEPENLYDGLSGHGSAHTEGGLEKLFEVAFQFFPCGSRHPREKADQIIVLPREPVSVFFENFPHLTLKFIAHNSFLRNARTHNHCKTGCSIAVLPITDQKKPASLYAPTTQHFLYVTLVRQPLAAGEHRLHRKPLASFVAASTKHALSGRRLHTTTKPVYAFSAALFWLVGSFRHTNSDLFYAMGGEKATDEAATGRHAQCVHRLFTFLALFKALCRMCLWYST